MTVLFHQEKRWQQQIIIPYHFAKSARKATGYNESITIFMTIDDATAPTADKMAED
jgi:hypothetical protein